MRKEEFVRELSRKLAALGWPAAQVRRTTQEIIDHWDDLEEEGRDRGFTPDQFATERIGTVESLATAHSQAVRNAHWAGRHPVLSFGLLPPLALLAWFLGWGVMAAGAGELYGKLLGLQQPFWSTFVLVLITAKVIHYTGLFAIPALFCWWARRSFCGFKWSWIACLACAGHGLLNHVTIQAHTLRWGYGIAVPDLLPVAAPLVVGAVAHLRDRLNWKLVTTLALLFMTGCASSKATQERGWIGGEYKAVHATPGILITRLQTNSPVARAGLREGDLVMQVDGHGVKNLQQFWQRVDQAQPGKTLALTVFRDGKTIRENVVVGREIFKADRAIVVGLLLAHEFDPWPKPDFSLVALGFKRQHQRVDLDSPESRFERSLHPGSESVRSREGWEVWLPVASFSSRKEIVSQSVTE